MYALLGKDMVAIISELAELKMSSRKVEESEL